MSISYYNYTDNNNIIKCKVDTKNINNNGRYHHTKHHPYSIIKIQKDLLHARMDLIAH